MHRPPLSETYLTSRRHTHERVDQVFSRFSQRLGKFSAKDVPHLFEELRKAYTPECNFEMLEGVIDWKEWLGEGGDGACPSTGQVLSISRAYQFSIRKPEEPIDHDVQAEIYMSEWSDTDVHGPEHFLKYVPEGKPNYMPGRAIFHSHQDSKGQTRPLSEAEFQKRFDDMEEHILSLTDKFDFTAGQVTGWVSYLAELREAQTANARPMDKFWPEGREDLQEWLRSRPRRPVQEAPATAPVCGPASHNERNDTKLCHSASASVKRLVTVMEGLRRLEWNPVTTIGPGKTNTMGFKQHFDAKQGNLVIMDYSDRADDYDEHSRRDLLGDWELTRFVGRVRSHKDLDHKDVTKRTLKLVQYEPWVPDKDGNPDIPLWLAVDVARLEGRPVPDTTWEVAQRMPWRPVAALPMRTYDRFYRDLGGVARSSFTTNFMGTAVPALKTLGKTFNGTEGVLEVYAQWTDLLIVMQFEAPEERTEGVLLPQDSLQHCALRLEFMELKASLVKYQNNDARKVAAAKAAKAARAKHRNGKRPRGRDAIHADPDEQLDRLHCSDFFGLDYHHEHEE